jgi:F420-dependent oxidoreductase-like protein
MKLCTALTYTGNIAETAAYARALEAAGIDMIAVPELYSVDAVSMLGYVAAHTERVELFAGILPIYSRTPALIAMTAAGLDAVSGGRFVLGLGTSGPQVIEGWHGVPFDKPLRRTREVIDICRLVWRRERVVYDGEIYTIPIPPERGTGLGKPLKIINDLVREDIPIYVAALGPKNVQLVAELADGWVPFFFYPEKAEQVWGEDLRAGAGRRLADRKPLEIVAGGTVGLCDDKHTASRLRDEARPMNALYIGGMGAKGQNYYNNIFSRFGYEAEAVEIQELYLDGKKGEAEAAIPSEFLEATSLVGDEGYVRERIQAHRDAGVTCLNITPVGDNPLALIEKIKSWSQ